jgi:hypothetical protein
VLLPLLLQAGGCVSGAVLLLQYCCCTAAALSVKRLHCRCCCCCCRLESVRLVLVQQGSLDDMLDAEEQLSEQLESLPYLVRFQYDKSR